MELEKYGNVCMLCCALELARLGLLSRFWLDYLTRGANEEQEHNIISLGKIRNILCFN